MRPTVGNYNSTREAFLAGPRPRSFGDPLSKPPKVIASVPKEPAAYRAVHGEPTGAQLDEMKRVGDSLKKLDGVEVLHGPNDGLEELKEMVKKIAQPGDNIQLAVEPGRKGLIRLPAGEITREELLAIAEEHGVNFIVTNCQTLRTHFYSEQLLALQRARKDFVPEVTSADGYFNTLHEHLSAVQKEQQIQRRIILGTSTTGVVVAVVYFEVAPDKHPPDTHPSSFGG